MSRSFSTSPGDSEAIEARAAAWLAQRDEGLTSEEAAQFAEWQHADPRHASAVARLDATWQTLRQLRDFRPHAQAHPDRDLLRRSRQKLIPFPIAAVGIISAAAAVVAVAVWVTKPTPRAGQSLERASEYVTTADGFQRVTLSDGSVLELNADSDVRVEFDPALRHVTLVRGEAHFTVAKNKARPFIVEAREVRVRAVGTAFNVRMASDNVEVLVTEGKVAVRNDGIIDAEAVSNSNTFVKAGERIAVATTGSKTPLPAVESVPPALLREALAWQAPRLRFVETPLADVIAQFNRRNETQIELADPSLANLPVDGSFRPENVDAFVHLLESNGGIRAERVSANRIVLHRE